MDYYFNLDPGNHSNREPSVMNAQEMTIRKQYEKLKYITNVFFSYYENAFHSIDISVFFTSLRK